jgi:hypothetical protein
MKNRNFVVRGSAVISGLLAAGLSQAAVDVTSVTTAIADAGTAAATVGAAVLVMVVGIKVYKWIRGAM